MKVTKFGFLQVLALAAACALPLQPARAGIVSTEATAAQAVSAAPQAISRDDVVRELVALGVDPASAQARVAALSEEELRTVAGRLDALPAGARLGNNELILILVLIILAVLVL